MSAPAELVSNLQGDVLTANDAGYSDALKRWSVSGERKAKFVVFVKSPQDVAAAIKYATSNQLPIAVRGGGHNAPGASSSEDGLVIDLSKYLNTTRIDTENQVAYVGGGATWKTVNHEAGKHQMAAVGATISDCGVGGFTLGGGIGWLTGAHGMGIDNLIGATVVTASGEILQASAKSNPDLFWGIRGGGCNFGVATEFIIKVHPQSDPVWFAHLIFMPTAIGALVTAVEKWFPTADPKKEAGMLGFTTSPGDHRPCVIFGALYNGPEAEGRQKFAEILAVGPIVEKGGVMPYAQINDINNHLSAWGSNYYHTGIPRPSLTPDTAAILFQRFAESVAEPPFQDFNVLWDYYPWQKVQEVSADATAYPTRTEFGNTLMLLRWDAGQGDEVNKRGGELVSAYRTFTMDVLAQSAGEKLKSVPRYANYEYGDVVPPEACFGANYPRLQEVKAKYDPNQVFSKWFCIKPAA